MPHTVCVHEEVEEGEKEEEEEVQNSKKGEIQSIFIWRCRNQSG